MYAGVAAPDQGQCVPSSPPHPRQGEQLLGRSWGQGSPRWQNRPEDPCVSTFWKSFKKLCWTHLSNWSPFKGVMPRSDGFIWWKNWLKLIPGTKYEQFLKYAALLNSWSFHVLSQWVCLKLQYYFFHSIRMFEMNIDLDIQSRPKIAAN